MLTPQSFVLRCPNIECAFATIRVPRYLPVERTNYQLMYYAGSIHIGLFTRLTRCLLNLPDNLPMGTYYLYYCPVCREEALYTDKHGLMRQVYLTENGDLRLLA